MTTLDDVANFRLHFEDLAVGQSFQSPRRTVTEADIVAFAGLSGDYNALHTDALHGAGTVHGERIAHGLLVLAIASGLSTRMPLMRALEPTLIGLTNLQVRWRRPTRIGDTLHVLAEVTGLEGGSKSDRGVVTMQRSAVNQHGEAVMISDWTLVVARKAGGAS